MTTKTKPTALFPTLTRVADRPAPHAAMALLTRALELGIHPTAVAAWVLRTPAAPFELRTLADNWRQWRSLANSARKHRALTRDPRKTAEKGVAWLLSEPKSGMTGEQHRLALTVVAVVALRTAGLEAESFGDAAFVGVRDLGVELGITGEAARNRLTHAIELGALDRRMTRPSGATTKLRIPRAPHDAWLRARDEGDALVEALVAGRRTVLDAVVHPAAAFGEDLTQNDALTVLFDEAGIDPRTRGFSQSSLTRSRRRLRTAGVTDTSSLLDALDLLAEAPNADGRTPRELRAEAIAKRRAEADARAAQIAEFRTAGKAAFDVSRDTKTAYDTSRQVTPLVQQALAELGTPGARGGEELRTWVRSMQARLGTALHSSAERAGAAALLARACEGRGRTAEQNLRLATLATSPEGQAA